MGCSRQEGTDQYYPTRAKWLSPVALTHCLLFQVACAKKLLLGQLNATGEDTVDLTLKALQEILTGPAARFHGQPPSPPVGRLASRTTPPSAHSGAAVAAAAGAAGAAAAAAAAAPPHPAPPPVVGMGALGAVMAAGQNRVLQSVRTAAAPVAPTLPCAPAQSPITQLDAVAAPPLMASVAAKQPLPLPQQLQLHPQAQPQPQPQHPAGGLARGGAGAAPKQISTRKKRRSSRSSDGKPRAQTVHVSALGGSGGSGGGGGGGGSG